MKKKETARDEKKTVALGCKYSLGYVGAVQAMDRRLGGDMLGGGGGHTVAPVDAVKVGTDGGSTEEAGP